MTSDESVETLQNRPLGIYLVRFSSSELGGLVISYKGLNNVQHFSVKKKEDNKYSVETREGIVHFNSVQEVIDSLVSKGVLSNSVLNPTSDIVSIIEKWKQEITEYVHLVVNINILLVSNHLFTIFFPNLSKCDTCTIKKIMTQHLFFRPG